MTVEQDFLNMSSKLFQYYKNLADQSFENLNEEDIHFRPNDISNNISIIVKHISGNMLSRYTDFLTTDGEKEWRERDAEFSDTFLSKKEMIASWEKGWNCLNSTLSSLQSEDMERIVFIRKEPHTVLDAITRQIAHYAYHIGQIVYVAKAIQGNKWKYLSILPNQSKCYEGNFLK